MQDGTEILKPSGLLRGKSFHMALHNSLDVETPFHGTTVSGRHSTVLTWLSCIQT